MSSRRYSEVPEAEEVTLDRNRSEAQPADVPLDVEAMRIKHDYVLARLTYKGELIAVPERIVYGVPKSEWITPGTIDYVVSATKPSGRVEITRNTKIKIVGPVLSFKPSRK